MLHISAPLASVSKVSQTRADKSKCLVNHVMNPRHAAVLAGQDSGERVRLNIINRQCPSQPRRILVYKSSFNPVSSKENEINHQLIFHFSHIHLSDQVSRYKTLLLSSLLLYNNHSSTYSKCSPPSSPSWLWPALPLPLPLPSRLAARSAPTLSTVFLSAARPTFSTFSVSTARTVSDQQPC